MHHWKRNSYYMLARRQPEFVLGIRVAQHLSVFSDRIK